MKKNRLSNKKWYNNAVALLIGAAGYVALTHLGVIGGALGKISSYFEAIVFGAVIAYLVNPLAVGLQNRVFKNIKKESVRWGLSIFVGMAFVLMLFVVLLLTLIPQLIESIALLVSNMDVYIKTLNDMITNLNLPGLDIETQMESLAESSEDLMKTLTQFLSSYLKDIVSTSRNIGRNLLNFLLAMILSFYLLGSKQAIKDGSKRLLKAAVPGKWYEAVLTFLNRCNSILVRYIIFTILDAVIVGGVNAVFMAIVGMEYIGLISVVVGVTNLIPSFGPVIGAVIGGFILLLVNPWHALMFLGFTCILQTLDGYVIKPKLFGNSLGVSGLLILIAIIVFGNIFGILGILLAIPLAAIIDFSYEEYLLPYLEARRAKADAEAAESEADDPGVELIAGHKGGEQE